MKFEFFISSAVVTAIASLVSAVISALISKRTAENTANKEIEKLKLGWEREDIISSDEEFAEMARSVSQAIDYCNFSNKQEAIGLVASVRSKEYGELGVILDRLYCAIKSENLTEANEQLSKAIDKKRSLKSVSRSEDRKI